MTWLVNEHEHGATVHESGCQHADPSTMKQPTSLRYADLQQAISMCRVSRRMKMCKKCVKRLDPAGLHL